MKYHVTAAAKTAHANIENAALIRPEQAPDEQTFAREKINPSAAPAAAPE